MNRHERRAAALATRKALPRPAGEPWGSWERRTLPPGPALEQVAATVAAMGSGVTAAEALADFQRMRQDEAIWLNAVYQVNIRDMGEAGGGWPRMLHLSVKRRDRAPLGPERFRHLQQIKNELVGPECEGVEVYPAESRLVDTSNQYHLWVFAEPAHRWPFGYAERLVFGPSVGDARRLGWHGGRNPRART